MGGNGACDDKDQGNGQQVADRSFEVATTPLGMRPRWLTCANRAVG